MYRKHLNKMDSKTGIKTVDKLSEIPVVNSAVTTATDYYGKVKETNSLLRTSCNLAELSFKTFKFAATPITYLCKKPIESMDTYLSDKVNQIENNYPSITKPTDQLTANAISQAKDIYDKTVKHPIETLSTIKDKTVVGLNSLGSNKTVQAAIKVGTNTLHRSADVCLENRFAKMLTDPMLDFTEKSLNYLLPMPSYAEAVIEGSPLTEQQVNNPTTIRRIYNINKRIYDTTFRQLSFLHLQFERTIEKLKALKNLFESFYSKTKSQVSSMADSVAKSSLASQCAAYIEKNNISLSRLESLSKGYYKAIMSDVTQILENYMQLVKKFPLVFNGTKLKQTIENFGKKINLNSFSANLKLTIDYLMNINQALISYTRQMFQVVSGSTTSSIKRLTSQEKSQSPKLSTTETLSITNMPTSTSTPTPAPTQTITTKTTTIAAVVSPSQSPTPIEVKLTDNKLSKSMSFRIDENIVEEEDHNSCSNKLDQDVSGNVTNSSSTDEIQETTEEEEDSSLQNENNFNFGEPEEDEDIEDIINKSLEDMAKLVENNIKT